jgi:hypothetical protein
MKRIPLFFALSLLLLFGCRRKPQDIKDQLEKTMGKYLADRQSDESTKPHFDVFDVSYFKDSTFYLCEFKIKMTLPNGQDTTGLMKQKISLDGKTVLPPNAR